MFKEYWNGYLALGIAVGLSLAFNIVGFLSVGFDWIGLEKASPNTYSYAEQQCSRQQAEHAGSPAAILKGDQAATAQPKADQTGSGEPKEPDWCDLAAQQSMADSTAGMEQTAWVALGLSIVGVILVWRTLYYTRETLREAQGATKAANEAVTAAREVGDAQIEAANKSAGAAREIGEAQVRAYTSITNTQIMRKGNRVHFRFDLANSGNSPARNFGNRTEMFCVSRELEMIIGIGRWISTRGDLRQSIVLSETGYVGLLMHDGFEGFDFNFDLAVVISSIYADVFNKERRDHFFYYSLGFSSAQHEVWASLPADAGRIPWRDMWKAQYGQAEEEG